MEQIELSFVKKELLALFIRKWNTPVEGIADLLIQKYGYRSTYADRLHEGRNQVVVLLDQNHDIKVLAEDMVSLLEEFPGYLASYSKLDELRFIGPMGKKTGANILIVPSSHSPRLCGRRADLILYPSEVELNLFPHFGAMLIN